MRMRCIPVVFSYLLSALFAACGSDARLGDLRLASGIDGAGRPVGETTVFRPGETVYLSIELLEAYQGLESTATWKRGDETLATQTAAASRAADALDPLFIVFQLETGADWPPGHYRCEVFIPDQGTTTLEFTLE
ncbi:MAG: hypothetical protein WBM17_16480 [Anaerolineales bacterium]